MLIRRYALISLAALALGAAPRRAAAEGTACGRPGKPPCPMQRWMRHELARPLALSHLDELAAALERLEKLNPEPKKWLHWNEFAEKGARAARNGRRAGAITSCAHCHTIYRAEYNAKYRTRAIE